MIYNIKLETSGIIHKAKGETILEALDNLDLTWEKIKGKGVLTVTQGKLKSEHLFPLIQLKRVFANKQVKILWAKRLELLLK